MKYKQWNIAPRLEETYRALRGEDVPDLVAAVLCARGLNTLEEAQKFLSWHTSLLCDPLLMRDMDKALSRIRTAIEANEKITVYGDYDVDGITATCLLTHYLKSQHAHVNFYIPDRLDEGYGLNPEAIQRLYHEGTRLIITVDCGITAVEETRFAQKLGVDVIITDHHECKEEIPSAAIAVVDPHRKDCPYPFQDLAGVGVALKLVLALSGEENRDAILAEYSDLAAVGTVADVMTLLGENRTLVRIGLNHLKKTRRIGLRALMDEAGTTARAITSTTVGFCLAPRINAAGRMGRATMAADLILTDKQDKAFRLAHELCDLNRERQAVELNIFEDCVARLEKTNRHDSIVLADASWHQGVVGIVASRLAERYACPVFMICLQDGKGKGSCRSYGGFNLFEALESCSDLLLGYGGHALAAGFTISEEHIDAFRLQIERRVTEHLGREEVVPTLDVDAEIQNIATLTVEEVDKLSLLEPYGNGNPKPVFALMGATITCMVDVGGGRHLKLRACRDGRTIEAIFFSTTKAQVGLTVGDRADLAFFPQINEYRGTRNVQLHLVDLRPSCTRVRQTEQDLYNKLRRGETLPEKTATTMIPGQDEFAAVWHYLRSHDGHAEDTATRFARSVAQKAGLRESTMRTMICLDVLEECGILDVERKENRIRVQSLKIMNKMDPEKTKLMQKLRRMAKQ
ncbi:MAG: single-stranded-DNA-specific exonuclease RecJ [Evtepia sp.]